MLPMRVRTIGTTRGATRAPILDSIRLRSTLATRGTTLDTIIHGTTRVTTLDMPPLGTIGTRYPTRATTRATTRITTRATSRATAPLGTTDSSLGSTRATLGLTRGMRGGIVSYRRSTIGGRCQRSPTS